MMYQVKRGYSYVDVNGRGQVFVHPQMFEGEVDPTQKWKLGAVVQEGQELPISTKGVDDGRTQTKETKAKTEREIDEDEMDASEET